MTEPERSILVVVHALRDDTVDAAARVIAALRASGARPVLAHDDRAQLTAAQAEFADVAVLGDDAEEDG